MDTITHGIAGALIAKSVSDEPQRKRVRLAIILGSVAPDLDLLGGLFTPDDLFELEFHRGITHSIVALPLFALLLALAWRKGQSLKLLTLGYAVGIASHIVLDVLTAYGTMIFQPLSRNRYTLDTLFIIDLTLGSLVLVPQLVAWAWSDPAKGTRRAWQLWLLTLVGAGVAHLLVNGAGVPLPFPAIIAAVSIFAIAFAVPGLTSIGSKWSQSRYCRIGLALSIFYVAACGIAHQRALYQVHELAAKYQMEALKVAALPAPPSLLHWSGLVQTADGITRFPITLGENREPSAERYVNSSEVLAQDQLQAIPQLQTYLWFARFPWVTAKKDSSGETVEYRDIQFVRPAPRGASPFTFRIQFDLSGNLLSAELLSR